jgi:hypothetical protein
MTDFDTDWDPYQELMTHKHNIEQLVMAVQHGSELMKQMGQKFQHQQQVIEQLQFHNQRLNRRLDQVINELKQLKTDQNLRDTGKDL